MRESGKVNVVGLLLIAAIVAGIFLAVKCAPAVIDNMDVQQAIDAAYAQAIGPYQPDDDKLRHDLLYKLQYVGSHKEDDGFGNLKDVQGLGFTDDDVMIDRDEVHDRIYFSIAYDREVDLHPLKKILTLHFHPTKSGPLHEH